MNRHYAQVVGSRTLSDEESQLMTQLLQKAAELRDLIASVENHISEQHQHATATGEIAEMERLTNSEPFKWLEAAKANFQTGIMHAVRSIAQPESF